MDFKKITFNIGTVAGIITVVWSSAFWLSTKMDRYEFHIKSVDTKMESVNTTLNSLCQKSDMFMERGISLEARVGFLERITLKQLEQGEISLYYLKKGDEYAEFYEGCNDFGCKDFN